MASSSSSALVLLLALSTFALVAQAQAQLESASARSFNATLVASDASSEYWPSAATLMSSALYDQNDGGEDGDEEFEFDEEENGMDRRSLYWRRRRFYISYGALSANRIPCPPRSGRSYYTPNCYKARGPVHPYTRGCSAITRCRG